MRSRRDWLDVAAAVGAFIVCLSAAVSLAMIGTSRLGLFAASLGTAIALFEIAVVVTSHLRR
ncbi:hypothetical protein GCM10029976_008160 [Kribbella albertanoniae]|uniref:Uncharacterized protein n=1 Tax=Kribbella albertanoniae TaxID=1266829 RepID=A0A4R4PLU7_9ACTN|nr:hypothetical protein [Kribbella albertanoniae]TDC23046.1 hypothetical protein E1261_29465 [Kribbella albertanoniae]